jgi:UDP-glucose 4-epimerase
MIKTDSELKGRRILVTGAAGFIGSRLIKALLDSQAEVVAMVDEGSSLVRIKPLLSDSKLYLVRYPVTDAETLATERKKWGDIDSLAHLGLRVPRQSSFCEQAMEDITLNLLSTLDLLKVLGHIGSICFASSVAVYGSLSHLLVCENDSPAPISSYAATKLAIENYLAAYGKISKTPVTILRYSIVYGPGELGHRAIPNFLYSLSKKQPPLIYGDGSEIRDYVYVDDVVQATIGALVKKPDRVLNIGSGQGYTTLRIAREVIRLYSADVVPRYLPRNTENIDLVCDTSLARELIGYFPRTSLEEGLAKEVEWYLKEGITSSKLEEHEGATWKEKIRT